MARKPRLKRDRLQISAIAPEAAAATTECTIVYNMRGVLMRTAECCALYARMSFAVSEGVCAMESEVK